MEVGARGDEELGELAGFVRAGGDGGGEARPQGLAGLLEAREGPRDGLGERVVDCGDEAGVEVVGLLVGGVGERRGRRGRRQDRCVLRFRVWREVEGRCRGRTQQCRCWRGKDEDCR